MKKHALIIGSDRYAIDAVGPLCAQGAALAGLAKRLADPRIGGYDQVDLLLNPDRRAFVAALDAYCMADHRDDLLLIHVAGLGIVDAAGRAHLLLAGAADLVVNADTVPLALVANTLNLSNCRRQLLLLDCAFGRSAQAPASAAPLLSLEQFAAPDRAVIAASTDACFVHSVGRLAGVDGDPRPRHTLTAALGGVPWSGNETGSNASSGVGSESGSQAGPVRGDAVPAGRPISLSRLYALLRADAGPAADAGRAGPGSVRPDGLALWIGNASLGDMPVMWERAYAAVPASVHPASVHPASVLPAEPPSAAPSVREPASPIPTPPDAATVVIAPAASTTDPRSADAAFSQPSGRASSGIGRRILWWSASAFAATAAVLALLLLVNVNEWSLDGLRISLWNQARSLTERVKVGPREDAAPGPFHDLLLAGGQGPAMRLLSGGFFVMGSPEDEPERFPSEGPEHLVRVEPFALGVGEVSFDEYDRFAVATGRVRPDDEGWGRGDRPVINVSWHDAAAYADWLGQQTGQRYRLPSEAEWEYAARAGAATPFPTGDCIDGDIANYNGVYDYNRCGARTGITRGRTMAMRALPANDWGLYHMLGNVWEWVEDCWHVNYAGAPADDLAWTSDDGGACERRVIRGGGWRFEPGYLRSAARLWSEIDEGNHDIGFRVARDP